MTFVCYPSSTLKLVAPLGFAVLTLSACVVGPTADPGLDRVIKAHYAGRATEEEGKCRSPRIDTIQSREPAGTSPDGEEIMRVRYSYYDRHADMDANWDALFHATQPCGGYAERDFTVVRTELGYRVNDMTGERRETGRSN